MSDRTNTLVDIYAWLSLARNNVGDLWSAIEAEMTKSQTAIENVLGSFETLQVLLNEREEAGVE
jgi:hypothetical protein